MSTEQGKIEKNTETNSKKNTEKRNREGKQGSKSLDILHIDMDAFFAAVEKKDRPELQDKPVIVGGTGLEDRGVVSAACYRARQYGIHSAMPVKKARQLCPQGVFLPVRGSRYSEVSEKIFDIFYRYSPLVEKLSIDEAFLDVSGCHRLHGSSRTIGQKIKKNIKERLGLTASVGISFNKFLAKLASDLEKPDGFVVIRHREVDRVLEPLPVTEIYGVGQKTAVRLEEKGVETIADLKQLSRRDLISLFGKYGGELYKLARGIDNRQVQPFSETKSISNETTFKESLKDKEDILSVLMVLTEKVCRRLRSKNLRACTVFIKVKYDNMKTHTRSKTLQQAVHDTETIYRAARKLLLHSNLTRYPLRLLGVGTSSLTEDKSRQLSLFTDGKQHRQKDRLLATVDDLKERFGEESIQRGRELIFKNSLKTDDS